MKVKQVPRNSPARPRMHSLENGEAFERDGTLYIKIAEDSIDNAHDANIRAVAIITGKQVYFPNNYEYVRVYGEFVFSSDV